jgi:glutaredoxin 3
MRLISNIGHVFAAFLLLLPGVVCLLGGALRVLTPQVSARQLQLHAQLGRVTVYKKESCPYCKKARELLEGKYGLQLSLVDIEDPDTKKREEMLQQMRTFSGGRNTVPQIFFNSEHLGGCDDVHALDAAGKLAEKVSKVRSEEVTMMQEGWYHPWY